jgi:hypothetical protein
MRKHIDTISGMYQTWRADRAVEARTPLYGLVAEFESETDILAAAHRAREAGYRRMDAYTPFPVHGLSDAIGFTDWMLPWIIFFGGVTGALTGAALQVYTMAYDYPWNVGGKPLISWPQFIPITFELTILFASFAAVFGMFALNGLPRPYHSIFNAPGFERASQDRFFLCVESWDPRFDREETARFLQSLGPLAVSEVKR